jgi:hypothetical protein
MCYFIFTDQYWFAERNDEHWCGGGRGGVGEGGRESITTLT